MSDDVDISKNDEPATRMVMDSIARTQRDDPLRMLRQASEQTENSLIGNPSDQ